MPPLKDVTTMVTAARSRHIRFTFIIQNFAQLTKVYGKEDAETIKGNCNILYLISSELQALEELSKMCGEVKSKEKEKTSSTPLVTVSDLQRLPLGEVIAIRLRMMPFKTKLKMNWEMNRDGQWGEPCEKAGYITREKKEVQLFDIREFVKAKKKEKMDQMMNSGVPSGAGSSPFGGMPGMGGNPFGGMSGMGGSPFGGMSSSPLGGMGSSPFGGGLNSLLGDSSDSKDKGESFNVDDLVKKIDAKIAELEEEERREKEEAEKKKKKQTVIDEELDNTDDKKLYEDGTFGDDFFNDFFSDD